MQRLLFAIFILSQTFSSSAQSTFINPIIPGGHPDPSICRVADDYYIVNSTFEYFPGLPIHHSKDLVNWELIGYGIDRPEQASGIINLVDVQQNGGIHAPSIRYNDGTFYIIVTNVYNGPQKSTIPLMVNFILRAKDPAGPWSDPIVVEGAPGIDPDLFFDDDGKVYFVGTHDIGKPDKDGIGEIWVQELDPKNWQLTGERASVWTGACGGCCVEGPHIYKENGLYYLLVAEGGTSTNHAVMMAASENLRGPYESNPRNPVFTQRHLSNKNWVHSTGHADLVQLEDGRWYMVSLGIRNDRDEASNMGRETFLMPMIWEEVIMRWVQVSETKWEPLKYLFPVVAPETGKVERQTPLPFLDQAQFYNDAFTDNFDAGKLDLEWNFRRVPQPGTYSLNEAPGHLRLYAKPETFSLLEQYSAIGFRQKESEFVFSAKMSFNPKSTEAEAGISFFQQDDNYINLTVNKVGSAHQLKLTIKEREKDAEVVKTEALSDYNGNIVFKVISKNMQYSYLYSLNGGETFINFYETADNLIICRGYIGTYFGFYATSNGNDGKDYADFDWVKYQGFVRK
ncbi:MAG: xylan 1,4-beta-xylosidase [Limisphaerales bacterium]|jgi:xylan 1,4-beta-xylosidase